MPELDAFDIARGTSRLLRELGYATLSEFRLSSGRRADLCAVSRRGRLVIVEVKSDLADFRADQKWPDYMSHCDAFYFAVAASFPLEVLPAESGIIVADRYTAVIRRAAPVQPIPPGRRRKETLRFALQAAHRLGDLLDPFA